MTFPEEDPRRRVAMLELQLDDARRETDAYRGALIALRDEVAHEELAGLINGAIYELVEGTLNVWRGNELRQARPRPLGGPVPADWTTLPGVTALADLLREIGDERDDLSHRLLAASKIVVELAGLHPEHAGLLARMKEAVEQMEGADGKPTDRHA